MSFICKLRTLLSQVAVDPWGTADITAQGDKLLPSITNCWEQSDKITLANLTSFFFIYVTL